MGKKAQRPQPSASGGDATGGDGASSGLDLLEAGPCGAAAAEEEGGLRVSQGFAKKYNARKDREELTRARRILADEDADHSSGSDSEPEDEAASLLTQKVEGKIFETLQRIRSKDPAIYDQKHIFFSDADFEGAASSSAAGSAPAAGRGTRYRDFLRETLLREGADAFAREEEEMEEGARGARGRKTATGIEEQQELRKSIISAARGAGEGGDGEDEADDLFTVKEKSAEERRREEEAFATFASRKDRQRSNDADDIACRYWKADEDLDESERFLRDYILGKGWLETTSMQAPGAEGRPRGGADEDGAAGSAEEDERHLEQADDFEKGYNFRFEMEDGQQIQGHKRFQEASVRERGDKRKRQRKERAERQGAEKIRRTEELKRLKNLKKQEIKRRLQQLQEVTGNAEIPLGCLSLDADFDPQRHDQEMSAMFGDAYDQGAEALAPAELVRAPQGCEALDVSSAAAEALARSRRRPKGAPQGSSVAEEEEAEAEEGAEGEGEDDAAAAPMDEADAHPDVWWLCDLCQRGIPSGKKRFDCAVCENYTLCAKCFRVRRHPHAFVRRRVPDHSMPPEDVKGQEADPDEMDKVLDEYFQLDYEDIIGGDLPTRFKYSKVEANDFGMSTGEVLRMSDQELNRVMPLKKLRTYREEGWGRCRQGAERGGQDRAGRGRGGGAARDGEAGRGARGKGGGRSSGARPATTGLSAQRLEAYNLREPRPAGIGKRRRPKE